MPRLVFLRPLGLRLDIARAHEEGILHFHDMDVSPVMNEFNCCLVNISRIVAMSFCEPRSCCLGL
ncbi:anaerobic ribonucleoside-triphosphate reductase, partial [Enterobacter hormaechei]